MCRRRQRGSNGRKRAKPTVSAAATRPGGLAPEVNPLIDYLAGGAWSLGAVKSGFAPAAYLAARPEVAESGMTPLEHWARNAQAR